MVGKDSSIVPSLHAMEASEFMTEQLTPPWPEHILAIKSACTTVCIAASGVGCRDDPRTGFIKLFTAKITPIVRKNTPVTLIRISLCMLQLYSIASIS